MIAAAVLLLATPMTGLAQGRGAAPAADAAPAPELAAEQARLEQMRDHMVERMRHMSTRMWAVQKRLEAIERGDLASAPPLPDCPCGEGMGGGNGMGGMNGMGGPGAGMGGMKARDGTGPGCPAATPTPPPADGSGS